MTTSKMSKLAAIMAASFGALCLSASAAVLTLEFQTDGAQGSAFDFNINEGTFVGNGASLFFESYVGGSKGAVNDDLNATTVAFGINKDLAGDDTNELDNGGAGLLSEAIRITFSPIGAVRLTLDSFDINSFSDGSGTFSIIGVGGSDIPITASGNFLVGTIVNGLTIEVLSTGSAFGFDGLTFTSEVVPEPSSMAMIGCSMIFLAQVRRHYRRLV